MTRIVALMSGLGWHVADLARAAKHVGVRFDPIGFDRLGGRVGMTSRPAIEGGGVDLAAADAVLVRMMPPDGLERVVFRMDALHRLEALGVPILNPPRAVEAAVDKYLALARLDAAGLPVPPTWVGERAVDAMAAFDALGGDVVVKPLFGSEGRGLVRASDRELAGRTFRTLERLECVLYVQRYIPNAGQDVRTFILGGQAIASIRRTARAGDWRANVALGGTAEPCDPGPAAEHLAIRAAGAVGAIVAGVDLLPDPGAPGGWTILEVNAVPGWKALAAATGIDVAARILDHARGLAR